MIQCYKCFQKGMLNRYGQPFEVGVEYHTDGIIKFGNNGNGFHACKRLEDTLRYFDAMEGEVDIAQIRGFGNFDLYEDDYYGYYDMYSFENIIIDKVLNRQEIMDYAYHLPEMRAERFVSLFRLTEEEKEKMIDLFKQSFSVLKSIAYYQDGDKDAFLQNDENFVLKYVKK